MGLQDYGLQDYGIILNAEKLKLDVRNHSSDIRGQVQALRNSIRLRISAAVSVSIKRSSRCICS